MADPLVVLIASPLESEHVDRIRAVDSRIEVLHDPDLLPRPRYVSDHAGSPTKRSPEQEARFLEMLGRAEVVFDFPSGHFRDLEAVAPRLRWLQSTSATRCCGRRTSSCWPRRTPRKRRESSEKPSSP